MTDFSDYFSFVTGVRSEAEARRAAERQGVRDGHADARLGQAGGASGGCRAPRRAVPEVAGSVRPRGRPLQRRRAEQAAVGRHENEQFAREWPGG